MARTLAATQKSIQTSNAANPGEPTYQEQLEAIDEQVRRINGVTVRALPPPPDIEITAPSKDAQSQLPCSLDVTINVNTTDILAILICLERIYTVTWQAIARHHAAQTRTKVASDDRAPEHHEIESPPRAESPQADPCTRDTTSTRTPPA
jgi:hypothetical protein